MAQTTRKLKIPVAVLERARKASTAPKPPPPPRTAHRHPREKIVAALRKLHPMD